ncbi:MAG TPA: TonB family protein [Bryobacteraceae bacterium]|jgi:TonB family protein
MESAAAQSAAYSASLDEHEYARWQDPYRAGRQIRMHQAPLRMLADEALRRLKNGQPSEIGGLLWGKLSADSAEHSIVIDDVELIPSAGSLYNSTAGDARALACALDHSRPDGLEVLGYFRSHVRDGLCLSAQDQELITSHLRNPEYVFLLIRPFEMGICIGAFFFWQDGRLQTDGSDLEVPFVALDQQPGDKQDAAGVPVLEPHERTSFHSEPIPEIGVKLAELSPATRPGDGPEVPRSSRRSLVFLFAAAATILIAITAGAFAYFAVPILKSQFLAVTEPSRNAGLGLRVTRAPDGQLDLTWKRRALDRAKAQSAQLTINDGPISKQLTIDSAQLRSGTLTYFPNGLDVQFRLEINLDRGHSVAESVRVILPGLKTAEVRLTQAPVRNTAPDPVRLPRESLKTLPVPSSAPEQARFRTPSYIPPGEIAVSKLRPKRLVAPDLRFDNPAAYSAPVAAISALLPPPPRPAAGTNAKAALPAKRPQATPSSAARPTLTTSGGYAPPRPIRQVMPDVKLAGRTLASQAGQITVQVTIDESGRVRDARLVETAGKASGLVASAAVTAARQWAFQPATLHGRAVAAEHRIVFDFRSQNQ